MGHLVGGPGRFCGAGPSERRRSRGFGPVLARLVLVAILLAGPAFAQDLREGELPIAFPRALIPHRRAGQELLPAKFPNLDELATRLADDTPRAVLFFKLHEDEHNHYAPRFAPDASALAFLRADINRRTAKIRVLDFGANGTPSTVLEQFPDSYDYMFAWGPARPSPLAAFASQAEASGDMNAYLWSRGKTRRITAGTAIVKHPDFHPTEPWLLLETRGQVGVVDLGRDPEADGPPLAVAPIAAGSQPMWAPDGKTFVYAREVGRLADRAMFEISVRTHPFGRERRVYKAAPTELVRNPAWSADGKHVAFYAKADDALAWRLVLADAEAGKVVATADDVVVEHHFDDTDPAWSPGADRVWFFAGTDQREGYYRIHWLGTDGRRGAIDYSDEFTTATDLAAPQPADGLAQLAFVATERLSQGVYLVVLNHW